MPSKSAAGAIAINVSLARMFLPFKFMNENVKYNLHVLPSFSVVYISAESGS
jgi:hypothetical protein